MTEKTKRKPLISITDKTAFLKKFALWTAVVVFFVAIIVAYYIMLVKEKRNGIILVGELAAKQTEAEFDAYLASSIDAIKLTSYSLEEMIAGNRSDREILDYLIVQSKTITTAIFENTEGVYGYINGAYLDGSGWVPEPGYVPTERPWYIKAIAGNDDVTFVEPYVDAQTGQVVMSLAKKLKDGVSVCSMDIYLDRIQGITEATVESGDSDIEFIVDGRGFVIAHSDRNEVGKNYSEEKGTLESAIISELKGITGEHFVVNFEGTSYIVYQATIQNDWRCLSVKDATSVFRPLKFLLALTITLVVMIVVVLSTILRSSIIKTQLAEKLNVQLSTTVDIYRSAHDLDLINDTFSEIRTNEKRISDILGTNHQNAQKTFFDIMDKLTDPKSKDEIMRFIDFSTINERMKDQKTITVEFLNTQNLWLRGRFIASERLPDGRISHVLWMVENIDEEKRRRDMMFEAVSKMNEQIRSVASIYMTAYEMNLTNDTFSAIKVQNRRVSELVGTSHTDAQETIYRVMERVTDPAYIDEVMKCVNLSTLEHRLRGTNTVAFEFKNIEGLWRRGRFIVSNRDGRGRATRVLWLVEDIDKEKTERNILKDMSERAIAASEAKSAFLSNMSHEIRTPINAVLGMNEMILRESDDRNILGYSESIRAAGNTLLGLVNDILDFSKIEAGKMEIMPVDYDLSSVINDLVNMVRTRADEKGLLLKLDIDTDIPRQLHGDDVRIKQAITNILTNAVKYTEKGSVTFSIKYEKLPAEPDFIMLDVAVSDTGIGIKPEDIKRLFAEFERIDEKHNRHVEGTGLGMTITQNLLDLMGTSLKVESVYGEGSTFSFRLKQEVVKWDALGDYEKAYRISLEERGRYHEKFTAPDAVVLMVDDNLMNIMVFKSLLKQTQICVDTALDGDSSLEMMRNRKYDIVFLDHMMPGKDGVETLQELKSEPGNPNINTPVICLTANAISGARDEYIAAGFDDYLTKPIDSELLENMLLEYLPKDLIKEPGAEESPKKPAETAKGGNDTAKALAALRGQGRINVATGVVNCGDTENYLSMLKVFYDTIDENTAELGKSLAEKDYKNYAIKIHALKSSARTVGATELGEDAQKLETAAKSGDTGYIDEHSAAFTEDYTAIKTILSEIFEKDEAAAENEKPAADAEFIASAFSSIKEAAEAMDYDTIELMTGRLSEYSLPESDLARLEKIRAALGTFDYGAIAEVDNG